MHSWQPPLFKPVSDWKPTPVSSLPSWRDAKRICIDIETCDPDLKETGPGPRRGGYIAGVAFAIEDGPSFYLPIQHSEDNLPREEVLSYLKAQGALFKGDLCGSNLSYDLDFLFHVGITFPGVAYFRDTQIAEVLIDELQESYSLQNTALRYGLPGKDEQLLRAAAEQFNIDPKGELFKLPGRFVADYALQDVRLPLQLLRLQEKRIDEQDLWRIYNLESRLVPVLARIRQRGIRVSERRLDEIERWCIDEEQKALDEITRQTGIHLALGSVWQTKVLATVLSKIGVKLGLTPTGKFNIDKDVLDEINHPVAKQVGWARKVNKLRTTFVKSVRAHLTNGRLHCVLNQMAREEEGIGVKGARYGRLSSEHPNMQQQPARDEFAARWRSIYLPEEGALWASCDYSQQEPRFVTHYAVKAGCCRAREAAEAYRSDPNTDNHQMMANLTGLPRKQAKNIYLGLIYGMGGAKLSEELSLPTKVVQTRSGRWVRVAGDEAQGIIDRFNAHAPFLGELAKKCKDLAAARGYITTILGRRCHFPKDPEGNYDWTHKALNRLIQGSSADQTKAAMVEADRQGFFLQLQVHDELDQSVASPEEAQDMARIMRDVVPLEVPVKVDVELGPSWGEVK